MDKIPTKTCTTCGVEKIIHEFTIKSMNKTSNRCKDCNRESQKRMPNEITRINSNSCLSTSHFCNRKIKRHKNAPNNRMGTCADGTHYVL